MLFLQSAFSVLGAEDNSLVEEVMIGRVESTFSVKENDQKWDVGFRRLEVRLGDDSGAASEIMKAFRNGSLDYAIRAEDITEQQEKNLSDYYYFAYPDTTKSLYGDALRNVRTYGLIHNKDGADGIYFTFYVEGEAQAVCNMAE